MLHHDNKVGGPVPGFATPRLSYPTLVSLPTSLPRMILPRGVAQAPRLSQALAGQALPSEAFTRPCNPTEPGPLPTATGGTICRRARLVAPPFISHRGPTGPSIYPVGLGVQAQLRFP